MKFCSHKLSAVACLLSLQGYKPGVSVNTTFGYRFIRLAATAMPQLSSHSNPNVLASVSLAVCCRPATCWVSTHRKRHSFVTAKGIADHDCNCVAKQPTAETRSSSACWLVLLGVPTRTGLYSMSLHDTPPDAILQQRWPLSVSTCIARCKTDLCIGLFCRCALPVYTGLTGCLLAKKHGSYALQLTVTPVALTCSS